MPDKFKYLFSLLEEPALQVIQGLPLTEANYQHALKLLKERFGRPQFIISAHMDNILKLSPCTSADKPYQLRYLFDRIRVQIRGLETMGVATETFGSLLIPIIMSKLPSEMRLHISRQLESNGWDIEKLLGILQTEIDSRETSENVKITEQRK